MTIHVLGLPHGEGLLFRNAVRAETVPQFQFTRPWGLTMKIIRLVKMSYCVHLKALKEAGMLDV
ncbi:hypothetical protein FRC0276_01868 [Corynebacterium diphtheriae]|nr:hypothetical protein FRC0192_02077 [Corynebacterium diphtheriae]CAB0825066.1 hypothetical protein FRC0276_01868 [Corynebacterium diphtheriae]